MKKKKWILGEQNQIEIERLSSELEISEIVAKLLINRSYNTPEKARQFIEKSLGSLYDPFLIPDMEKGVERIRTALEKNEKITIYGDYDVDGVTSSVVLFLHLKKMGANVEIYIPDRVDDGYGVSTKAIDVIAESGTKLIITVDCGITASAEVLHAKELGIDTVVTDHHECKDSLPEAIAIINPKRVDSEYPFKDLAGVGVAFKLICALIGTDGLCEAIELYGELVAFGTIADVMPLVSENRIIVAKGLQKITNTKNTGLRALISEAGLVDKKITAGTIGYALAPRINAAGRVSSAMLAARLLLTEDITEASSLAKELCDANRARQEEENEIFLEALSMIKENNMVEKKILVLSKKGWHHGIIGIVASRITEIYYLPVIIISFDEHGNGKGSCRSIPSFSIYNALESVSEKLEKFGGHSLAAGISIDMSSFESFKEQIETYAEENITEVDLEKCQQIDCEIQTADINITEIEGLSYLEPYGVGCPSPVFLCRDLKITEVRSLSGDKHTRLTLDGGGKSFYALFFGQSTATLNFFVGDDVDICCSLDINVFRGEKQTQVVIKDIRRNAGQQENEERERILVEKYRGGTLSDEEKREIIPIKQDFVNMYRAILKEDRKIDVPLFSRKNSMKMAKFIICIDVFEEMGLIKKIGDDEFNIEIEINQTQGKVNLLESKILRNLGR